jgi:hypothetical protein
MTKNNHVERQSDKEEIEPEPFPLLEYLKSPQGHELASRIVTLIEEIKKVTLDKGAEQTKLSIELTNRYRRNLIILQGAVFVIAILSASILSYYDKFNTALGILFGTLVGYFFGRENGILTRKK